MYATTRFRVTPSHLNSGPLPTYRTDPWASVQPLDNVVRRQRICAAKDGESQNAQPINVSSEHWLRRRREILLSGYLVLESIPFLERDAMASEFAEMEALKGKDYGKPKMSYPDFTKTESGLQYKELESGSGPVVKEGDVVLIDWIGYTIGYYGRPFEARNKAKGGAFVGDDKEFLKVKVGSHEVIPGIEEALYGMQKGSVRRIVVPLKLGYPNNSFKEIGPKPSTFSGQRVLSFVIENQGLIDKTLLFDIEIIKII